jgi:hypothetical protein
MEVRAGYRERCDVAWECPSACRDALYILRVAGTGEVLGGVRTRGLEGGRPLKCKDFNPNWQFGLKYLHFVWTSEPLTIFDASMEEAVEAAVGCEGGKRRAKEEQRAKCEKTSCCGHSARPNLDELPDRVAA